MDNIQSLWMGASYQDHLLQSYRKIHLLTQAILLLIGVLLTIAIQVFSIESVSYYTYGALVVFSLFGIWFSFKMKKLIAARSEDVDYYHNSIIEAERLLPEQQQVLTNFKVYQKFRGKGIQHIEITDELRSRLVEKGSGHARKVLDKDITTIFYILWIIINAISLASLFNSCACL